MSFSPSSSTTLFLGDLSIFCQENDLFNLFHPFGPIENIEIKRSEKNKPCLAYGFIKFAYHQSAEQAVQQINGSLFLGRNIRVCWALDDPSEKSPLMKFLENKKVKQTAQIHVSFNSRNPSFPVSESSLRELFLHFGEIIDVTINKTSFNKDFGYQSGYGFIHYPLTPEGIQSAVTAVNTMNQRTVSSIAYECSLSHGLKKAMHVGPSAPAVAMPSALPTHNNVNLGRIPAPAPLRIPPSNVSWERLTPRTASRSRTSSLEMFKPAFFGSQNTAMEDFSPTALSTSSGSSSFGAGLSSALSSLSTSPKEDEHPQFNNTLNQFHEYYMGKDIPQLNTQQNSYSRGTGPSLPTFGLFF